MSQIIKAFTALFLLLYMMVATTSLLGAFFQVLHAQNLHASMIDELENSNYANQVIEECFEVCKQAEYELEMILYLEHEENIALDEAVDIPAVIGNVEMARVCLQYPFQLLIFDIDLTQELCGYAR